MRIAIAQLNPTVGDLRGNSKKIAQFIKKAEDLNASLVVFPELCLTGYPPEDLLLKPQFIRDNITYLRKLKGNISSGLTAIVGFVDKDIKGNLYNAAAIMHNKKIIGVYRKMCLPNYGVFDEKRYFKPGDKCKIFTLKLSNSQTLKLGINICEDIWQDDGPTNIQAEKGASLIINISASPYYAGKIRDRQRLLIRRAKENKVMICYANLVGGQDELVFDGGSMFVDKYGKIIAQGLQFKEELIVTDISAIGGRFKVEGGRLGLAPRTSHLAPIEEIYEALVLGIRDYVRKNGFKKVVIGLSGGIDSSLTAVIAVDALKKDNVIGVSMPSIYSSDETRNDAKLLAENLNLRYFIIPIDNILDAYIANLSEPFKGLNPDVTEENLQARIRGNILMALSNKFGWLVLTTGNKSEMATGYCTLYGDMAGGFAVLKDVPKTVVYQLSDFRNSKERLIPETVIKRVPTAELKPNQIDQDTLPAYDVLDSVLRDYVELDRGIADILRKGFDRELVKKVISMVDKSEYKRRQGPPGIKITPKAFGKDRRMPITNGYTQDAQDSINNRQRAGV